MIDGSTATMPLNPGFNIITDPNNISLYEGIGLFAVGTVWGIMGFKLVSWIYKVTKASIEYKQAKKELMKLEHKLKEAELRALEIQAGL